MRIRAGRFALSNASGFTVITLAGFSLTLSAAIVQAQTYTCPGGFGPVLAPIAPADRMASLKTVANPVIPLGLDGKPAVRDDLIEYVADLGAAIQLGKALFWEMQAGSDNKTACASCHFNAGADTRTRNQLNAGADGKYHDLVGANGDLSALAGPSSPTTMISPSYDDIAGSQGVRATSFQGFNRDGTEKTTKTTTPRQVTNRNSPSVINSVYFHREFWDGRAQPEFNGATPFGNRDSAARVWSLDPKGGPVQVAIMIPQATLASQAVGPALSSIEMSAAGRTFPDLGKKLLSLKPLGLQKVDPTDSVLGVLADTTNGVGLKTSYTALVQKAFQPKWWNARKSVSVGGQTYTMMQANFSLYWGLAIMLYEATLVSDETPMDQYLATRVFDPATGALASHDPSKLAPAVSRIASDWPDVTKDKILAGLDLFELPAGPPPSFPAQPGFGLACNGCHVGAETSSATIRNLAGPGAEAGHIALKNAGFDLRMERMFMKLDWTPPGPLSPVPLGTDVINFDPKTYAVNVVGVAGANINPTIPLPVATYDSGWYNLGVRKTVEDAGLGGSDPFKLPLSWTKYLQAKWPDPSFIKVPGNSLGCAGAGNATFPNQILNASGQPLLSGPMNKTEASDVDGSFKTPGLRNQQFNGPYFHNGGKSTLRQVVSFYDIGGDFTNPSKAPAMTPLLLTDDQEMSLVAFMLALTDDRVAYQKAPFDHPELRIPNGDASAGVDATVTIPAVGAQGATTPVNRFLGLNPFLQ